MYIKILLNYIMGYLTIVVEGYFIEKFMNICTSKQIFLWNMKREKSTILQANIGIYDFRQIVKIAKKTKCKVIIKQKKGIPFVMKKYKKRKIFLMSVLLTASEVYNYFLLDASSKASSLRNFASSANTSRLSIALFVSSSAILCDLSRPRSDT